MKTFMLRKEDVEHKWYVIDAEGKTLGRLATQAAAIIRGKNKTTFTPNVDCGDNVIIINAAKVVYSGDQDEKKIYYHHTLFPGGLKSVSIGELKKKNPVLLVEKAVKGMLPQNKLGDVMRKHLYVYEGAEHDHAAQKPIVLK